MPFILDDALAAAIASSLLGTGGNFLGRLLSRPKRDEYDLDTQAIMAALSKYVNRGAATEAGMAGQAAAEAGTAQGVTGGAMGQIVSSAQAPVYAAAEDRLAGAASDLEFEKQNRLRQYRSDRRQSNADLWGGTIGDVAGGLGAWSAISARDDAIKKLTDAYSEQRMPGRALVSSSSPNNMVSRSLSRSLQRPIGNAQITPYTALPINSPFTNESRLPPYSDPGAKYDREMQSFDSYGARQPLRPYRPRPLYGEDAFKWNT